MNKGPLVGLGRTAEIYAWGDDRVIKLFNSYIPVSLAQRELDIALVIEKTGLPVPHVEAGLVQQDNRAGIVYERIRGPSMLHMLQIKPWMFITFAKQMADLHIAIHQCKAPQFASYKSKLEKSIEQTELLSVSKKQAVQKVLAGLPDGTALCHADFHPDNIIMTEAGPRIIDWMTAAQSDPPADVARTSMMLQLGGPMPGTRGRWLINALRNTFHTTYLNRYLRSCSITRHDVEAWRVPTMAARLNEHIPEEHTQLLKVIDAALSENS